MNLRFVPNCKKEAGDGGGGGGAIIIDKSIDSIHPLPFMNIFFSGHISKNIPVDA